MRFVVAGAGAVGCYLGGRLAASGARVTLVGRDTMLAPLQRDGLTVTDLAGYRAQITAGGALAYSRSFADAAAHGDGDAVVLLTVKGPATSSVAAELGAAFPPGTPVVSFQNGVENVERAKAAAPLLDIIAGMVPYNVAWLERSRIHRGTGGNLYVADLAAARRLEAPFAAAGLGLVFSPDMRAVQWGKLLVNLNNPVNALSGVTLREEFADRNYRRAWAVLIREGLRVLEAARIEPARILTVGPEVLARVLPLPDVLFRLLARRMASVDANARSSMADDLRAGRKTEIDDLCGAIVRLGAIHGIATPANAAAVRLVAEFNGVYYKGKKLLTSLA